MWHLNRFSLLTFAIIIALNGFSQTILADTSSFKSIIAGPEYAKPKSFQKAWGRNWRTDWATPVYVPVLWLDKVEGGLKPEKTNGGNETKGLKLTSPGGKEYALRSINKSRNDVVPKEFKGTFIEDIIQDGVSMSHPYGAFALPYMQEAAGIYHTEPKLVYVPKQPVLDSLNEEFGDDLYMIEQRLSCDWSDADNLGNFKDFLSTDEVVEKLKENNHNKADQIGFVKARLFDMLLADWDRHEDQWKWGERKQGDKTVYIAVPRDRDQVFFVHNGFLIDKALPAIGNGYMQNFDYKSKNISKLNYEERNIDPFFTNEMTMDDWVNAATGLQQSLTDAVIEQSIRGLPPEIFAMSGNELIEKLKSRREQLVDYARQYYLVLAKEVEIVASKEREFIEIKSTGNGELAVKIFAIDKEDQKDEAAVYSRVFKPAETKRIRLFGIGGEDVYAIDDKGTTVKLSVIGGEDRDSVIQYPGSSRIQVYDNKDNVFKTNSARFHTSSDSANHAFDYYNHEINKKGFIPDIFYNDDDRMYIGLRYGLTNYKWRKRPYANKQMLMLHYSVTQNAISVTYTADIPNVIGKWNLSLLANFDAIRWANFFGLGNETTMPEYNRNFYRIQTREWLGKLGLYRQYGKSTFTVSGFAQNIKMLADTERYVGKVFLTENNDPYKPYSYVGGQLQYSFVKVNDSIVPTRGIIFFVNASYFSNVERKEFFQEYIGKLQFYIPFGNKFSLVIKTGGSTVVNNSEALNTANYYEHAIIGGPVTLRGFRKDRFWGQSALYNTNDLRFITNIRTHWLNAKAGALIFFDEGRVWMPNESSRTLHTSYGCGIMLAPFRKISGTLTYGISKESRLFQATVYKIFK